MKKMSVFLVVLLALCMAMPASAQIKPGVSGGVNLANVRGEDLENADSRLGFAIGGFVT